jgi:hypothetical protein
MRIILRIPIGFEEVKHHNVFSCPFHKCHLSLSNKKCIHKMEAKGG